MKIAFIRPSMSPGHAFDAMEPLQLAILSALTPAHIERTMYDERVENIPADIQADLVAMSVETFTARRAYQLAEAFHARGLRVIMGGPHPTLCPDEAMRFADAIVSGDAEDTWPQVLSDAQLGTLKRVYSSALSGISPPLPDRTLYGTRTYGSLRVIQTGRGCPHHCDFCSVNAIYGNGLRKRPLPDVLAELRATPGRLWFFADDNLFSDAGTGLAFCEALRPLNLHWACQAGLDTIGTPGFARRMAESGCKVALCGLESLQPANLAQIRKNWTRRHGDYMEQINVLSDHGIMVYGTFVFGYDADTPDTIRATLDFALRAKLFMANFNPLIPFPRTPLYERLRTEGRLVDERWWLSGDYRFGQGLFHPRGMTAEALAHGCFEAKTEFNRITNILHRAFDGKANRSNLALFWLANTVARREIRRKQGICLGTTRQPVPFHLPEPQCT